MKSYPGFSVSPSTSHTHLEKRRVELSKGVWAFIGYSSSNFAAIASEHGYIMVDTGDNVPLVRQARREIESLTAGRLQGIVLTHSHLDHRCGGSVFLEDAGDVPIWGHYAFGTEARDGKGLETILGRRTRRQFGFDIPTAMYTQNAMLPRFDEEVPAVPISPNTPVQEGRTKLDVDGVTLELYTIPTESADMVVVWLPEQKVLFGGDTAYGSFPNLYPLRGGAYRDVERWARGVRRLMDFPAQALLCGHNLALFGEEISDFLEHYAQALEYVHATTIRGMNEGMGVDELAATIELPEELRDYPYLKEFYGAVPWAVRAVFAAKVGWFDGNPTHVIPLTPREEAERMARLAGGEEKLMMAARAALAEGDWRWACRLADCLLALGAGHEVELLKADALEALSHDILPITGINYLLTCALELRKN
ncbi:alkyl/aryl-sulfatase [uncultured Mailhella sp.]|uniref:alkyl/aryl-sulfatase n=1 Tax=uncultured Mailhella sp. TaxID=1981031 RepID=UPI003209751D